MMELKLIRRITQTKRIILDVIPNIHKVFPVLCCAVLVLQDEKYQGRLREAW